MPSRKCTVVIGVDLDGVCADFYSKMREIAAEWLEVDINSLTPAPTYGLREWGIKNTDAYERLHRFAVTQRQLFESSQVIRGARRVLRLLSNQNYRIRIITHRLFIHFFHETAVRQTITWLDRNGIPYRDLCFMKEKEQVGAHIYIDDGPGNIKALRDHGHYAICFANSTNTEIEDPRAKDWDEVYRLIKKKFPTAKSAKTETRFKSARHRASGRRSRKRR